MAAAFLWTPDEARALARSQLGRSACGPTALLNVLTAASSALSLGRQQEGGVVLSGAEPPHLQAAPLRLPPSSSPSSSSSAAAPGFAIPSPRDVLGAVPARQRRYDSPDLVDYLLSRAQAGTTHADLLSGVEALSGGSLGGVFVSLAGLSPSDVGGLLRSWLEAGAVPLATLNLFLVGGDAWHHQMVWGCDGNHVRLANPVEKMTIGQVRARLVYKTGRGRVACLGSVARLYGGRDQSLAPTPPPNRCSSRFSPRRRPSWSCQRST